MVTITEKNQLLNIEMCIYSYRVIVGPHLIQNLKTSGRLKLNFEESYILHPLFLYMYIVHAC